MTTSLHRSLGFVRGTALLLNIVIGTGLLTLPGLAIKQVGSAALGAWLLCALAAAPLVAVFIVLGKRFPDAGGIASHASRAFGSYGCRMVSFLFLGAVIFGLPAIALTGGHYLASQFGGHAHAFALALLMLAVIPHALPGESAAKGMTFVASLVLLVISFFLLIGFVGLPQHAPSLAHAFSGQDWKALTAPFMMLFFAFTGWEVGASIAEEYKNPERDYPVAMVASFCLATALYFAIAYVSQNTDLKGAYEAPFVAIVYPLLGDGGAIAVALTAALIVFANLSGAIWGVSRMVFGLARDGQLPEQLAVTQEGRPVRAVMATMAALVTVLAIDATGVFGIETMLRLAGQNFLILYGISAAALFVLAQRNLEKFLGLAVIGLVLALVALQGPLFFYPLALAGMAKFAELVAPTRPTSVVTP
jgi:amino acid efflux transporter